MISKLKKDIINAYIKTLKDRDPTERDGVLDLDLEDCYKIVAAHIRPTVPGYDSLFNENGELVVDDREFEKEIMDFERKCWDILNEEQKQVAQLIVNFCETLLKE